MVAARNLDLEHAGKQWLQRQAEYEGRLRGGVALLFRKQGRKVAALVENTGGEEEVLRRVRMLLVADSRQWERPVFGYLVSVVADEYNAIRRTFLSAAGDVDAHVRAVEYAGQRAGKMVKEIREHTEERLLHPLRGVLARGLTEGQTITELAKAVRRLYRAWEGARSVVIARTETTAAAGWGSLEAARDSKAAKAKTWVATLDDRTREGHSIAHGQTVGLYEPFDVDGVPMQYPGDSSAPAELVVNCRCTMTYDT